MNNNLFVGIICSSFIDIFLCKYNHLINLNHNLFFMLPKSLPYFCKKSYSSIDFIHTFIILELHTNIFVPLHLKITLVISLVCSIFLPQ